MGSFNETCALSELNISPGTQVRLLFLTAGPYVNSDQHEATRGCYHYDQWFARTPPIKATYDDYGRCKFEENSITKLITECFNQDVVERPFGFNQYHATYVTKTNDINHFIEAASQGRLLVRDDYGENPAQVPDSFPTWQKVHAMLKAANLPIQSEVKNGEGYNAQKVIPGVVCVKYNSYGNNFSRLAQVAKRVFALHYDYRIVFKDHDRTHSDPCIILSPLGAYQNRELLFDKTEVDAALNIHPEYLQQRRAKKVLPVQAVMIHEDVWQAYLTVEDEQLYIDKLNSIDTIVEKIKSDMSKAVEQSIFSAEYSLRDIFFQIPFQTMIPKHIEVALKDPDFDKEELFRCCAEIARVEHVMSRLNHSWHIPSLGGQNGAWNLRTNLLEKLLEVSRAELRNELDNE